MRSLKVAVTPETRIVRDEAGHIRSIFDFGDIAREEAPFEPADVATQLLAENEELFDWPAAHSDLKRTGVLESSGTYSVAFVQEFKRTPVDAAEVTVNLTRDGQPYAVYSNYAYDIPEDLDPAARRVEQEQALKLIRAAFRSRVETYKVTGRPRLIIYRHRAQPVETSDAKRMPIRRPLGEGVELIGEDGVYYVAWEVIVETNKPYGIWRVLLAAETGGLVDVQDLLNYATPTGKVFDPDPVTTSGDTTLKNATAAATLNKQMAPVTLQGVIKGADGKYRLEGPHVKMTELLTPTHDPPSNTTGTFEFGRDDADFVFVMAYYHIDRFQRYLQGLGFTSLVNYAIEIDARSEDPILGSDNSFCTPPDANVKCKLNYGTGGIPDAEDAGVIVHEYGHAIQNTLHKANFWSKGTWISGLAEGCGDFLVAAYHHNKHAKPSVTVGMTYPWDANIQDKFWGGAYYNRTWDFNKAFGTNYDDMGDLWASVLFEIYRKLGGDATWSGDRLAARDLGIKLLLDAHPNVSTTAATPTQMAQEIEKADRNLKGWQAYKDGLHAKVIYDAFRMRQLAGFKEKVTPASNVDVYIDDGRQGKYDWLQAPWHPKDIWSRLQKDGDQPGKDQHQEPFESQPAYLYVKVRNCGTEKAAKVTVKAYSSAPAVGLVWPDHFTPMKPASIDVLDLQPDPQNPNGTIVGPFEWTPTASSGGCVLAILECAQDEAITKTLTGSVNTVHLVRFDNNIAQRNLSPVPNTGSPKRRFLLANPDEAVRLVDLVVTSTLPDAWQLSIRLPELRGIRLGPLERRWVEFEVTIPPGSESVNPEDPPRLSFEGLIDGRSIGGTDYYFAPPETFGWPGEEARPAGVAPWDLLGLHIPWDECEVEGTLEVKLRFKKRV
jgi:zinc metalloprotease ZmpB